MLLKKQCKKLTVFHQCRSNVFERIESIFERNLNAWQSFGFYYIELIVSTKIFVKVIVNRDNKLTNILRINEKVSSIFNAQIDAIKQMILHDAYVKAELFCIIIKHLVVCKN